MTSSKAIHILSLHIQNLQGNLDSSPSVKTLNQALQAFKKFQGAVEVKLEMDYDFDLQFLVDAKTNKDVDAETIYAIPKEKTL